MRILSNDALAALDSGRFAVRCLLTVQMAEPEDLFAIWDDVGNITIEGVTYTGAAGRFTVDASQSVKDGSIQNLDVTLSGLDAEVAALIDSAAWHQRPISITRAIIATDSPTVLHLMPEYSGFLDQMIWKEQQGGTSEIKFRAESVSREFNRSGARTRSSADQKERDPLDGFFDFAASAISTQINWGTAPQDPAAMGAKKKGLSKWLDKIL